MKKRLFAGLLVSAVLGVATSTSAEASCRDSVTCFAPHRAAGPSLHHRTSGVAALRQPFHAVRHGHRFSFAARAKAPQGPGGTAAGLGSRGSVVSLIEQMAPGAGVPTWFALRIARVESNYNPTKRGSAGEYGVFQLKCQTAHGIGYGGGCGGLLDARTNVQWGLKHLALAISSSGGNLRLAASKHNGGLGQRTVIASYVAKVF